MKIPAFMWTQIEKIFLPVWQEKKLIQIKND